jgi:hypothetical protein
MEYLPWNLPGLAATPLAASFTSCHLAFTITERKICFFEGK